jgi:hypothetical protein
MLVPGDIYCPMVDVDVCVIRGEGGPKELGVKRSTIDKGEKHL